MSENPLALADARAVAGRDVAGLVADGLRLTTRLESPPQSTVTSLVRRREPGKRPGSRAIWRPLVK